MLFSAHWLQTQCIWQSHSCFPFTIETKGLTSWSCSCRNSCRGRTWSKKMESFSFSKFLRSTLRVVSCILVAWLSGLKRERERKKEKGEERVNLFPAQLSHILFYKLSQGRQRPFPPPSIWTCFWFWQHLPQLLTHLFVCFSICNFCPLQRAGLPVK